MRKGKPGTLTSDHKVPNSSSSTVGTHKHTAMSRASCPKIHILRTSTVSGKVIQYFPGTENSLKEYHPDKRLYLNNCPEETFSRAGPDSPHSSICLFSRALTYHRRPHLGYA
jgi:hypothetical protein